MQNEPDQQPTTEQPAQPTPPQQEAPQQPQVQAAPDVQVPTQPVPDASQPPAYIPEQAQISDSGQPIAPPPPPSEQGEQATEGRDLRKHKRNKILITTIGVILAVMGALAATSSVISWVDMVASGDILNEDDMFDLSYPGTVFAYGTFELVLSLAMTIAGFLLIRRKVVGHKLTRIVAVAQIVSTFIYIAISWQLLLLIAPWGLTGGTASVIFLGSILLLVLEIAFYTAVFVFLGKPNVRALFK